MAHEGVVELVAEGAPITNTGHIEAEYIKVDAPTEDVRNAGDIVAIRVIEAAAERVPAIDITAAAFIIEKPIVSPEAVITIAANEVKTPGEAEGMTPPVIIQAKEVRITAKRFGSNITPLNIDADKIHIKSIDSEISILDSIGIGTAILLRGPPGGFGAIIYNKDADLTLEADKVTFSSAGPISLYGNITFFNFICDIPDKEIYFEAGHTYTFKGADLAITGGYDVGIEEYMIKLRSSEPGTQWYFDLQTDHSTVNNVNISDAYASKFLFIPIGVDAGNNFNIEADPTWKCPNPTFPNWSTAGNWTGNAVPSGSQNVVFDGTSVYNCTIDDVTTTPWSGGKITINGAYTGTITQSVTITTANFTLHGGSGSAATFTQNATMTTDAFSQTGGTFNQNADLTTDNFQLTGGTFTANAAGTVDLTISGSFTQNSGAFTAPGGIMQMDYGFTRTGGTFTHNSGTVRFLADYSYTVNPGKPLIGAITFYNVDIRKTAATANNRVITFSNNFNIAGNLTVSNSTTRNYYVEGSNYQVISFSDATTGNVTISSTSTGYIYFGSETAKQNLTLDVTGNFTMSGGYTYVMADINFTDTAANQTITQTSGTIYSGTWTVNKGDYTATLATALDHDGNLMLASGTFAAGGNTIDIYGWTQINGGTFTQNAAMTTGSYGQSGGTFTNSADLTVTGNFSLTSGTYTGAADASVDLTIGGTFNQSNGTLTLPQGTTQVGNTFTRSGGTFTHNSGTVKFLADSYSYTISPDGATFYNVTMTKTTGNNRTLLLSGICTIAGTLTVSNASSKYVDIEGDGSALIPTINLTGNLTFSDGGGTGMIYFGDTSRNFHVNIGGNFTISYLYTDVAANFNFNNQSSNQTVSQLANSTISGGTWTITKDEDNTYSVQLSKNLTLGGSLIITSGVFYTNGKNLTVSGTFSNEGTLRLQGVETTISLSMDNSHGTVEYVGDGSTTPIDLKEFGYWDYYNLTINDSAGTTEYRPGSIAKYIAGEFTITSGTYNANGYETKVEGDTVINGGTYTASSAKQSLHRLDVQSGTFTGSSGDVYVNGPCLQSGGTFTAPSTGTLYIYGNFLITSGTFTHNSGTVSFDNTSTAYISVDTSSNSLYNILHNGTGTSVLLSNLTVANDFTVGAGTWNCGSNSMDINGDFMIYATFTAPSSNMYVAGDFSNIGGTFNHNDGSVVLDGASTQTIYGSFTFYNLVKNVTTARTLKFAINTKQTIKGTLDLCGAKDQLLSLASTSSGTQWQIDPQGPRTILYCNVSDSYNINSETISAYVSTDGGRNTGWTFPGAAVVWSGASNTDWDTSGNWDLRVPLSSDFAIIANVATQPVLATNVTVDGLTLQDSATLTLNGKNLTVSTTFINRGTVILKGSETVSLTNDTTSGTWRYIGDNSGSTYIIKGFGLIDYYNLTINDANASKCTFALSSTLVVNNALTVTSGTYDANGEVTTVNGTTTINGGTYLAKTGLQTFNNDFTISNGTFTGSTGNADVNGNFSISGGTFTAPSATLYIEGNFSSTGGTFTHNSGTVEFDSSSGQHITPGSVTFKNVTHSGAGAITHSADLTVAGNLVNSAGTWTSGAHNITISGNFSNTGTAVFNAPLLSTLAVAGDFYMDSDSTFRHKFSLVQLNGATGTQTFTTYGQMFFDVTHSGAGTVSLAGNSLRTLGTLTNSAGTWNSNSCTIDLDGNFVNSGSASFIAPSSNMNVDGNFTISGTATFNANSGTVLFVDSGKNQTLTSRGQSFYNLYHQSSNIVTQADAITITNDFTSVTGTWNTAGYNMTLGGDFTNDYGAVYTPGSGTLTLNGGSGTTQQINSNLQNFNNITHSGAGAVSIQGWLELNGNLTNSAGSWDTGNNRIDMDGSFLNSNTASFTAPYGTEMAVGGNFTNQATAEFIHNHSLVELAGDGGTTQTFTSGGDKFYSVIHWGQSSAVQQDNLTLEGSFNNEGGTWTCGSYTMDIDGNFMNSYGATFTAPSTMNIGGDFINDSDAKFVNNDGTVILDGSGNEQGLNPGGDLFYDITHAAASTSTVVLWGDLDVENDFQNLGGTWTCGAKAVEIDGDFTNSATFNAPSDEMYVAGNFTNNNTSGFNHNNGTIYLDGGNQTITGSATFYNLVKIATSAYTLTFQSGSTQTIKGTLDLEGYSTTTRLSLRPGTASTEWYLDPQGPRTVLYVDVTYSNNINSDAILAYGSTNASDHNTNWSFETITTTWQGDSSANWSDADNWSGGNVPDASTVVLIPLDGTIYQPTLDVNASAASLFLLRGTTLTLGGKNLTVSGTFSNYEGTVILQGGETISLTNDTTSGTWEYVGDGSSGTFTIKDFGSVDYYNLKINDTNATKRTFALGAGIFIENNLNVTSGTYNANGYITTVDGAATVDGANGTYLASTGNQFFNDTLTISEGTFTGSTGNIDVDGHFSLSGGTFTAPSATMYIYEGFGKASGATFTHNNGTVKFDGGASWADVSGSTTFYNFDCEVPGKWLIFEESETQTMAGSLTLKGASGSLITLRSSEAGQQWNINPQGSRSVYYVNVKDSNNANAAAIKAYHSVNVSNNTNWEFVTETVAENPSFTSVMSSLQDPQHMMLPNGYYQLFLGYRINSFDPDRAAIYLYNPEAPVDTSEINL